MKSQFPPRVGAARVAFVRRGVRAVLHARFETLLGALLLLTVAAIGFQDRILERTERFSADNAAEFTRRPLVDSDIGGTSSERVLGPFHWDCELRAGYAYPYCGYELFFVRGAQTRGLNLRNLRSIEVSMLYRGAASSFRVHLKNFDSRYGVTPYDDTPKFMRVEFSTDPGKLQHVTFKAPDFGVADWWLRKWRMSPELSHPEFDNITSINFETGSEAQPGYHEFEVREIVVRSLIISETQWLQLIMGVWAVMIGLYLAFRFTTMRREVERRRALHAQALRQAEQAEDAARHDPLTGIFNRRGILERHAEFVQDGPTPIAVIMIDIDRFKLLNDTFGHNYGDQVLCSVAALIRRNVRPGDTIGRWGGEEFLVLCPGIDAEGAMLLAELLRTRIEHFHFGDCEHVTASFGVHWCPASGPELSELVSLADLALYNAKGQGRNRALRFLPGMAKAA